MRIGRAFSGGSVRILPAGTVPGAAEIAALTGGIPGALAGTVPEEAKPDSENT